MGASPGHWREEACKIAAGLSSEQDRFNRDPCGFQNGMATTGNAGVRVFDRRDNPNDASFHQGFGAGRRAAMVGAGFKGDIGGSPPRGLGGAL
mgnify:CR=1 FL=1